MTIEANGKTVYGYAGKILRINLTDRTTETLPTSRYAPEFVGGRTLAERVYWDEVQEAPDPFSPDNKLILMTGPGCATGLPYSSRSMMVGVGAMGIPSQFMYSGIGGMFGGMLKYAGYDGFILEGAASEHTYVMIKDGRVEFRNADHLWGKYVADTQDTLQEELGKDFQSLVIGPAGENRVRFASIATSNDAVAAKAGYGAVWGAKNLKAIAVCGTGFVEAADKRAVLDLRKNPSVTPFHPNPLKPAVVLSTVRGDDDGNIASSAGEHDTAMNAQQTNCMACVDQCAFSTVNVPNDPLPGCEGRHYDMVNKCLDPMAFCFDNDCGYGAGVYYYDPAQEVPGKWRWFTPQVKDPKGPYARFLSAAYPGDKYGLWGYDVEFGRAMLWLCNQYGLDKWEIDIGIFCWLSACYKEGLLEGIDTGFEGDPCTMENCKKIMHAICYREGFGDVLAEGVARASRILGKAKFGDTVYHGRFNSVTGERLDIPVSFEVCWGFVAHWSGRGFQGCTKCDWLSMMIGWMVSGRETASGEHHKNLASEYEQYWRDPYHSDLYVDVIERNLDRHDIKDMTTTCDFRSPNPTWPDLEAELFTAATGIATTQDDLHRAARRSRLLARAIYMRNHHRTRDMEVDAMFPWLTWPDPWGEIATWDDWNDLVDKVYAAQGWDLATGWPYRSTWEKYGLGFVADEMERIGMLPPEGGTPGYVRKPCPFPEHGCPVAETPEEAWAHVDPNIVTRYHSGEDPRMMAIVDPSDEIEGLGR